ncbi:MAG: hypothetical protein ACTSX9_09015 [Candidatus Njordarchaeales archaeon]
MIRSALVITQGGMLIAKWKKAEEKEAPSPLISAASLLSTTFGLGGIRRIEDPTSSIIVMRSFFTPDLLLIGIVGKEFQDAVIPQLKKVLYRIEKVVAGKIDLVTKVLSERIHRILDESLKERIEEITEEEYYALLKDILSNLPKDLLKRAKNELKQFEEKVHSSIKSRPRQKKVKNIKMVFDEVREALKTGDLKKAWQNIGALEASDNPLLKLLATKVELLILLSTANYKTLSFEELKNKIIDISNSLDQRYQVLPKYILEEIGAYIASSPEGFEKFLEGNGEDIAALVFGEDFKKERDIILILLAPTNYYSMVPLFRTRIGKVITLKLKEGGYLFFYNWLKATRVMHDIRYRLYLYKKWNEIGDYYIFNRKEIIESILAYEKNAEKKLRIFKLSNEEYIRQLMFSLSSLSIIMGLIFESGGLPFDDLRTIVLDIYENIIKRYMKDLLLKGVFIGHEVLYNIAQGVIHILSFLISFLGEIVNRDEILQISSMLVSEFEKVLFTNWFKGALPPREFIGQLVTILHEYGIITEQFKMITSEFLWVPLLIIEKISLEDFRLIFKELDSMRRIRFEHNLLATLWRLVGFIPDESVKLSILKRIYNMYRRLVKQAFNKGMTSLEFLYFCVRLIKKLLEYCDEQEILNFLDDLEEIDYVIASDPEYLTRLYYSAILVGSLITEFIRKYPHLKDRILLIQHFKHKLRLTTEILEKRGFRKEARKVLELLASIQ